MLDLEGRGRFGGWFGAGFGAGPGAFVCFGGLGGFVHYRSGEGSYSYRVGVMGLELFVRFGLGSNLVDALRLKCASSDLCRGIYFHGVDPSLYR